MRHRVVLSYRAEADGRTAQGFIDELLSLVPVP
jgi:MoxR-like ATPase